MPRKDASRDRSSLPLFVRQCVGKTLAAIEQNSDWQACGEAKNGKERLKKSKNYTTWRSHICRCLKYGTCLPDGTHGIAPRTERHASVDRCTTLGLRFD